MESWMPRRLQKRVRMKGGEITSKVVCGNHLCLLFCNAHLVLPGKHEPKTPRLMPKAASLVVSTWTT